jgi:peptidoglycan hydrolase-like protein with peptidoglycan-binding domain
MTTMIIVLASIALAALLVVVWIRTRRREAPGGRYPTSAAGVPAESAERVVARPVSTASEHPGPAVPEPEPEVAVPSPEPSPPPAEADPVPATNGDAERLERTRALQRQLSTLGLDPGPVDGRYGERTTDAVRALQHSHGLVVDGIVGPLTADVLRASAPQPPTNGRTERVKALQRQLSWLGLEPGPADGRYGPLTTGAVKRFQEAKDLPVDGVVDRATADALRKSTAQRPSSDRLDRVKALQRQLAWVGMEPGPIDGRYGPLTTEAVRRFQEEHELSPTGVVDPATHTALQLIVEQVGQW